MAASSIPDSFQIWPISHSHAKLTQKEPNMSLLRNLPIARKFTVAFGTVCALCLLLGVFVFLNFRSVAARATDVRDNTLPSIMALGDLRNAASEMRLQDLDLLLCQSATCTSEHTGLRQQSIVAYEKTWTIYEPMIGSPEERETAEKMHQALKAYSDLSDNGVKMLAAGKTSEAFDALASDQAGATFRNALSAVQDDLLLNQKMGQQTAREAVSASVRSSWVTASLVAVILGLCAMIGFVMTRMIATPLRAATDALERVANKDLTVSVEASNHRRAGPVKQRPQYQRGGDARGAENCCPGRGESLRGNDTDELASHRIERQCAVAVGQDQPDRRRRAGDDGDHRRDQQQRRERRRCQPPVGPGWLLKAVP
jgi:CHASE3 domain sensor protein